MSLQPMSMTKIRPVTAQTAPTGVKSNIENGSPRASARKAAMMILGGVPMSVTRPPRIVANDNGMSVSAGLRLAPADASRSSGISNASAPTLFIIAESAAPTPARTPMCALTLRVPLTT